MDAEQPVAGAEQPNFLSQFAVDVINALYSLVATEGLRHIVRSVEIRRVSFHRFELTVLSPRCDFDLDTQTYI